MNEFLRDIGDLLGEELPLVERFDYRHFGYAREGGDVA